MRKSLHRLYISTLVLAILVLVAFLTYSGLSYYSLPLAERFYHPQYEWFKASGTFGHGLGVIGTALILVGVVLYVTAKKYGYLDRYIRLKYILEFHIFLCTAGPIMILYHTTFKFGGIISIGFWSMALVVLSGIVGRYIYIQIPRTISGREIDLNELNENQRERLTGLKEKEAISGEFLERISSYHNPYGWGWKSWRYMRRYVRSVRKELRQEGGSVREGREALRILRREIAVKTRIQRLERMRQVFKYWHVAHRPFAIVMLLIVTVHVVITIMLGYRWLI